jgi:hypothetical protein
LRSLGGSLLRTGKLTERRDEFQWAAERTSRSITSGYFDCGIVRDRPCEGASSGIPVFLASHDSSIIIGDHILGAGGSTIAMSARVAWCVACPACGGPVCDQLSASR